MQKPRTFLCTFGYTESFVLSLIPKFGLKSDDKIVLIGPKEKIDKAEYAEALIKKLVESFKLMGGEIKLDTLNVDEIDFEKNVLIFKELIQREAKEGKEIILNLSGGMRIIILALYLAALTSSENVNSISICPENRRGIVELPKIRMCLRLSRERIKVLEALSKGRKIDEVALSLKLDKSTVYRHTKRLEDEGFIIRGETSGTPAKVTLIGKLAPDYSN